MKKGRLKINGITPRKAYGKHIGMIIPPGFEVHHIDGNRRNNDFENLVSIPKALHEAYHRADNMVKDIEQTYQRKARTIKLLSVDERFNFYDLMSGKWKDWYEGTQEQFTSMCHKYNQMALFLDEIIPAYYRYKELKKSVMIYKKEQLKLAQHAQH